MAQGTEGPLQGIVNRKLARGVLALSMMHERCVLDEAYPSLGSALYSLLYRVCPRGYDFQVRFSGVKHESLGVIHALRRVTNS